MSAGIFTGIRRSGCESKCTKLILLAGRCFEPMARYIKGRTCKRHMHTFRIEIVSNCRLKNANLYHIELLKSKKIYIGKVITVDDLDHDLELCFFFFLQNFQLSCPRALKDTSCCHLPPQQTQLTM